MPTRKPPSPLLARLDLPEEVSTQVAAQILGVDTKTVLKYYAGGQLPGRNIAPAASVRPVYRFPLSAVLKLRAEYTCPPPAAPAARTRRSVASGKYCGQHIRLQPDTD